MNKSKLKYLNDTLKKANAILGATHRPFPDFEVFVDDDLPSCSDAVLILSHYQKSMEQFYADHSEQTSGGRRWCVKVEEIKFHKHRTARMVEDEDD